MKERFKIYFEAAGAGAKKVAFKRMRFDVIAIVLVVSLAIGVMIGYLQAGGFGVLIAATDEVRKAVNAWAVTDTPDPEKSQPALPPVRRAPDARPVLKPGPFVSDPEPPPVATSSTGGSIVSAATPIFSVQVGAFRLRTNAEALVKQLSRDGFKASINQSSALYMVQVGTFHDRKDANRVAKELKAKRYDVFVTRGTDSGK